MLINPMYVVTYTYMCIQRSNTGMCDDMIMLIISWLHDSLQLMYQKQRYILTKVQMTLPYIFSILALPQVLYEKCRVRQHVKR